MRRTIAFDPGSKPAAVQGEDSTRLWRAGRASRRLGHLRQGFRCAIALGLQHDAVGPVSQPIQRGRPEHAIGGEGIAPLGKIEIAGSSPNRSSGSKGVRILECRSELDAFREGTARISLDGRAILEELIPGSQHTCEGFLWSGEITFSLISDQATASRPHTATTGHYVPSLLSDSMQQVALRDISSVLSALRITDGPFDCDFVVLQDTCVVLEIAPRLGGNSLSTLVRSACAVDLVEAAVRFACGDLPAAPIRVEPRACAILILGVEKAGTLSFDAAAVDALRKEDWVGGLTLDLPPSATVRPFTSGRDRVGEALILADSRIHLDLHVADLKRRLRLAVECSS